MIRFLHEAFEADMFWAAICGILLAGWLFVIGGILAILAMQAMHHLRVFLAESRRRFYQATFSGRKGGHPSTINPEVHMKSRIALVAVLAVALAAISMLTGCGTLGNGKLDNPLVATPYQAGRTMVFIDLVTEPIQPAEVASVIDQVYALAQVNLGSVDLADEIVLAQIAAAYPDSTPEFRQVLFNVYKLSLTRLASEFGKTDLPKPLILSEFFRGVNDALELYRPSTAPPAEVDKSDLATLLDDMAATDPISPGQVSSP